MKISNLTNARYLIVAALASANLVLFQNCSNYSGRVALEGMKEKASVTTDGVPSDLDTGGATVNMGDTSINTGTTNGQQNNGTPSVGSVELVNPNGTTSMMNGSAGGMNNADNVLISLDDPNHISDADNDSHHGSGNNNSGGGNNSTGTMGGISISDDHRNGHHEDHQNNGHHDGDDSDDVAESHDNHQDNDSLSSQDSGSLCSLHSMVDEDKTIPKKVIVLTSADENTSLSYGNEPGTSGKIYIVYTGKETLHLSSLNHKGGRITICGNIKIDNLSSNGKVKLIFAQALSVEVNGNLSTSKLELSGSMVSEIEVDKKAGKDVKRCHIDSSLNIIADL